MFGSESIWADARMLRQLPRSSWLSRQWQERARQAPECLEPLRGPASFCAGVEPVVHWDAGDIHNATPRACIQRQGPQQHLAE